MTALQNFKNEATQIDAKSQVLKKEIESFSISLSSFSLWGFFQR